MRSNIEKMEESLRITAMALEGELARVYPKGATVTYRLREGAAPQKGNVTGWRVWRNRAYVEVRLAPSRSQGFRYVTVLPVSKIVVDGV